MPWLIHWADDQNGIVWLRNISPYRCALSTSPVCAIFASLAVSRRRWDAAAATKQASGDGGRLPSLARARIGGGSRSACCGAFASPLRHYKAGRQAVAKTGGTLILQGDFTRSHATCNAICMPSPPKPGRLASTLNENWNARQREHGGWCVCNRVLRRVDAEHCSPVQATYLLICSRVSICIMAI